MADALALAPLVLTLLFRQACEGRLRGGSPAAASAGAASVAFWWVAYCVLLGAAGWRLWGAPVENHSWAGYAVLWVGIALRQWSLLEIGAYYHQLIVIRDQHRLIDTGPYRFLRHPLHLGLHLEMLGFALLAAAVSGWLALGASLIVLVQRNRREEESLQAFFGLAYENYRRRSWDLIDLLPGRTA